MTFYERNNAFLPSVYMILYAPQHYCIDYSLNRRRNYAICKILFKFNRYNTISYNQLMSVVTWANTKSYFVLDYCICHFLMIPPPVIVHAYWLKTNAIFKLIQREKTQIRYFSPTRLLKYPDKLKIKNGKKFLRRINNGQIRHI